MNFKTQPAEDHEAMCNEHSRFTDTVGDRVIALQDAAYELGRKRGKLEADAELLATLKRARGSLASAIKSAWEGSTDVDVAENLTIKAMDAAIAKAEGSCT